MYRCIFLLFVVGFFIFNTLFLSGQIEADFTFSPGNACSGSEVSFTNQSTGSGSISYLWEFGDGNTSTQVNPTHVFNADPGDGTQTYYVKLTASQGSDEHSVTKPVIILRPPSTNLIDPLSATSFSSCSGENNFELTVQNASFTDNASYQIDWGDGSSLFTTDDFDETIHTYTSMGFYELVYTVTGENGCSGSEIYTVLNGSDPSMTIGGPDGSVGCAPLHLTYTITEIAGNYGTNYIIEFDDGSEPYLYTYDEVGSSISVTHEFAEASCILADDYYTFFARAENQCGFQEFTISPIRVDREPIAIISAPDTVCLGDNVTFYNLTEPPCGGNANLTNYTWIVEGVQEDVETSSGSYNHVFSTPGDHDVTLIASNATVEDCNNGISDTTITIIVIDSAVPDPPAITGPSEVCQGAEEITITATEVNNADEYIWELPSGVNIISGAGTNTIVVNFSQTSEIGEVEVTVRGANICNEGLESDAFQIFVHPLPAHPGNINGVTSICYGQEVVLSYEVSPVEHVEEYIWTIPDGAEIVSNPNHNSIDVLFKEMVNSGNISVWGENECGFGPVSSININVSPVPDDAESISSPGEICEGERATFEAEPINYTDLYVWLLDGEEYATTASDTISVLFESPGIFQIGVYGVNPCGEGSPVNKDITVNPSPQPEINPQDHCYGSLAIFIDEDSIDDQIESWNWSFGDGYSSILPSPVHIYNTIGEFEITLEAVSADGCKAFVIDTIKVYDVPISRFSAERDTVYVGQPVQFIDESYLFHDTLQYASDWFYDFYFTENPGQYTIQSVQNPQFVYQKTGKYTVKQEVNIPMDVYVDGCPDYSFLDIVVVMDFYMPSAFAPGGGGGGGGDGVIVFGPVMGGNDFLPNEDGSAVLLEFSVFNRWGERVHYEKSANPQWDGTIRGGPVAPQGVYVWRIMYRDGQGKPVVRTGSVMLLK